MLSLSLGDKHLILSENCGKRKSLLHLFVASNLQHHAGLRSETYFTFWLTPNF